MMLARVASVPMPVVSLSFCFSRGSSTSLATFFIALIRSPSVKGLGGWVHRSLRLTSATAQSCPCCKAGSTCATGASRPLAGVSASGRARRQPGSTICLPTARRAWPAQSKSAWVRSYSWLGRNCAR
ncbi:hypothetical protein D3C80_1521360 [compost metagenome]